MLIPEFPSMVLVKPCVVEFYIIVVIAIIAITVSSVPAWDIITWIAIIYRRLHPRNSRKRGQHLTPLDPAIVPEGVEQDVYPARAPTSSKSHFQRVRCGAEEVPPPENPHREKGTAKSEVWVRF